MDMNAMDMDPMDSQPQPSSQLPAPPVANPDQSSSASALPPFLSAAPLQQTMSDSATLPAQLSIHTASMQPTESKMVTKKVDISSLMSPPDPVIDSFPQTNALNASADPNGRPQSMQQPVLLSPPISPHTKPIPNNNNNANASDTLPNQLIKDPVLYPAEENSPSTLEDRPLFAPADRADHKRSIDRHVQNRSSNLFNRVSPPRNEDYELALTFKSQVMNLFVKNRVNWLRRERAYLQADRTEASARQYQSIAPAKAVAAKPGRIPRSEKSGVSKPQGSASRPTRLPPAVGVASGLSKTTKPAARRPSATPEPTRRGTSSREDKDFKALKDYCPPTSSLPNKPNSLKVDWRGQPIDLSNDPHRDLLHPDEVMLAGSLRLDCATYLTNKRRMFERRLECLRTGKEFRKTDAQQACKIDVNKASKLWTAFDKVGWLEAHWVRRFL